MYENVFTGVFFYIYIYIVALVIDDSNECLIVVLGAAAVEMKCGVVEEQTRTRKSIVLHKTSTAASQLQTDNKLNRINGSE